MPSTTKREKTLGSILKSLAEGSSLHGIPKIVSSKQRPVKILWVLLFLATFTVFVIQLYSLFSAFYTYPIKTTVSLKFNPLPFPAITFCNMNPVKSSQVNKYPALEEIVHPKKKLRKSNKRHGRAIESSSDLPETISSSTLTSPLEDVTSKTALLDNMNVGTPDGVYRSTSPATDGQSETSNASSLDGAKSTTEPSVSKMASTTNSSADAEEYYYTDYWDWSDPWDYYDYDFNDSYSIFPEMYYDYHYLDDDGYYSDQNIQYARNSYIQDQLNSQKDEWDERKFRFRATFKNESHASRIEMGHKLEDLVLSASFASSLQNISKFDRITTTEYGNCYTMTSRKYIAMRSGMAHGLKLTLNLELGEYIKSFVSGYGVRVVFHEVGTFPLPAEEGMTLSPGYETSVALKAVRVERLGKPYGNCSNGKEFQQKYKVRYSFTVCMHLCRIERTVDDCDCIPADAPDLNVSSWNVPICSRENRLCQLKVEVSFDEGTASDNCNCISPCRETVYVKTISGRHWPNRDYLDNVLMTDVCRKNISSMKDACDAKKNGTFIPEKYDHNFLRLLVYYEDLNYETILEEPLYEPVRFVSDVGGVTGLFLGASVLSLIEVLQLILEIILFWGRGHKLMNHDHTKEQENEKTESFQSSNGSNLRDTNRTSFPSTFT